MVAMQNGDATRRPRLVFPRARQAVTGRTFVLVQNTCTVRAQGEEVQPSAGAVRDDHDKTDRRVSGCSTRASEPHRSPLSF